MRPRPRAATLALLATGSLACGRTPTVIGELDDGGRTDGFEDPPPGPGETEGEVNCIESPELCVAELSLRKKLYMRDAAYVIAVDRVAEACRQRGWV